MTKKKKLCMTIGVGRLQLASETPLRSVPVNCHSHIMGFSTEPTNNID